MAPEGAGPKRRLMRAPEPGPTAHWAGGGKANFCSGLESADANTAPPRHGWGRWPLSGGGGSSASAGAGAARGGVALRRASAWASAGCVRRPGLHCGHDQRPRLDPWLQLPQLGPGRSDGLAVGHRSRRQRRNRRCHHRSARHFAARQRHDQLHGLVATRDPAPERPRPRGRGRSCV